LSLVFRRPARVHAIITFLIGLIVAGACALSCPQGHAQELLNGPPQGPPIANADAASLDGCQMIARINNQIVLACEVLWRVNHTIELNQERIPPDQVNTVRQQLLKRELAGLLDRKLIYDEFHRNVPPENLPRLDENLRVPFQEKEIPDLMKQLKVNTQRDLERELARLGSSLEDLRRSFNERVIASEWVRSKVKINEEVMPDEMLEYYQAHLTAYDYPAQARWEELMVRKGRFADPREAYAELARMGREVLQQNAAQPVRGPAFAAVARSKSDGITAQDGGLQNWTSRGALKATAIDQALFSLQVGQMSPILESEDGFHIVRVLERNEAGREPFTEVQGKIREKLKEERFQAGIEQYLSKLRRDASIWTAFTGKTTADVLLGRQPGGMQTR
jgi:parvulin-like peptidyl-prolyl isomerase